MADSRPPVVQGTLVRNLFAELTQLRADEKLTDEELEAALGPAHSEYTERPTTISSWYPLDFYLRMLHLVASAAPVDPREYLAESGRRSARRVIELGIYSQLAEHKYESWENRVGRILVSLSGSFFDFGHWHWQGLQGDRFTIRATDVGAIPDELATRIGGFIEELACRAADAPVEIEHRRYDNGETIEYRARRVN